MNSEDKVARWHWKAVIPEARSIATARRYEFRLIHWYVPADATC